MPKKRSTKNWEAALSPEQHLVLCCARAAVDPSASTGVRVVVQSGLNWADVAAYAARHHLSPIAYEVIVSAAQDLTSSEQLNLLRQPAEFSATCGMALLQELLRLQCLFENAQIQVIPYKGPVLAWLAYGSFIRREYTDLDFAVRQEFIPDVVALMKSVGYSAQFSQREAHAGQKGFAPGQYSFFLGSQGLLVEFHTERTLRYFPDPLDFRELTRRLIPVEISGQRFHTFSIEDTLLMLCVHGAKHFWERMAWVLDIAKLTALADVDWELLREIAAGMASVRVLRLGLFLAHCLFAAPLPPSWLEEICRDHSVRELAETVCRQYAGISDRGAGIFSRAMFRIRMRDKVGEGFRQMLRLTLSPTESDRQAVRLPSWLMPLYSLVRPWRLLREYGLGSKRR